MTRLALADVVTRVRDRVPAGRGTGRFVGLEHLVPGQLRVAGAGDASGQRSDGVAFRAGDLLFGALRPGFRKVAIAPWDGVGSAELLVLRPRTGEHPGFALAWLADVDTIAAAVSMASGTRMPRVRWRDLAGVSRRVPDPDRRDALGRLALVFDARLRLLHQHDATLAALLLAVVAEATTHGGARLGDVARPRPTSTRPAVAGVPVLSVADLPSDGLAVHTWGRDPGRSTKRSVHAGDVLVSRLRPGLRKSGLCPVRGLASPEIVPWVTDSTWQPIVAARVIDPLLQRRWTARASGTRMPRVAVQEMADTPLGIDGRTARALTPRIRPMAERLLRSPRLAAALRDLRDHALHDRLDAG